MFDQDVADLVQQASHHRDCIVDAIHLTKAAEKVRRDRFQEKCFFDGSYPPVSERVHPDVFKSISRYGGSGT